MICRWKHLTQGITTIPGKLSVRIIILFSILKTKVVQNKQLLWLELFFFDKIFFFNVPSPCILNWVKCPFSWNCLWWYKNALYYGKEKKSIYSYIRLILLRSTFSRNGILSVKNKLGWVVCTSLFPFLLRCTFNRKLMSSHFLSTFNNEVIDLHWMFQDSRKWLRVIQ